MSQCVPRWDVDDNHSSHLNKLSLRSHSNSTSAPDVPMLDYEVAELTWVNGQLAMHGLGQPRVAPAKPTWEKPRACGGTLESIVNQATRLPRQKLPGLQGNVAVVSDDLVPWFDHRGATAVPSAAAAAAGRGCSASTTMTVDALVPCSNRTNTHVMDSVPGGGSTRVGSCSLGPSATVDEDAALVTAAKRGRVSARVPVAPEWSGRDQTASNSATFGRDSQQVTLDTCDRELGVGGFTSATSFGSQENTSSGMPCSKSTAVLDENDSVCHSRPQREAGDEEEHRKKGNGKSSVSTKRSRAAAIHNQSERKRRDKINQRMNTLQKLVPNSSKTDKASMLDEVIEYLKQLQAQVHMMSRMNIQPPAAMMLPMAMQQQLQMSMMNPMGMAAAGLGMGMGMGMGAVMDMNAIGRANISAGIPQVLHPNAFMPITSWDGSGSGDGRLPAASSAVMPDPLSAAFLACQSQQPMSMEAYSRMAALYQQFHQQPPASSTKS